MRAIDTFRTSPYLHNCAQAIAYRWSRLYPQADSIVALYAPFKGGKAPEGLCGALYAATQACPSRAAEIQTEFEQQIGAIHCRDIKGVGRVPCQVCVQCADSLVEKYSNT